MKNSLTVLLVLIFIIILLAIPLWLIKSKREGKTIPSLPSSIRKPSFAGSFYPADPASLGQMLNGFLGQAELIPVEGDLKILIVPHAGLEFSGQTAAWGFKQIESKNYTRVILLGASHKMPFDYAAVCNKGSWETPLGKVAIDEDFAARLLDGQKILADSRSHDEEHSLEVELIFLQKVLDDFKIVPVLLGQVTSKTIDGLAEKISQNMEENTLLVVSSDLSHYPSWSVANEVDGETIKSIIKGDRSTFESKISDLESKNYPGLDTCACGQQAISVALKTAEILSVKDFRKIKYENSGDVSGDKSRVVGYVAIGAWSKEFDSDSLDEAAKTEALKIARNTLEGHLGEGRTPSIASVSAKLNQQLGAFVTLRNGGQLRGCIGEFEPKKPLYLVIEEMAIAAATEDSRFPPVTAGELEEINIEISVMTPKRKINDWQKIELGKHGVVVQKGQYSGTFLPQVATETGWSKEEFLSQLCTQKAGLPSNCYKDRLVNLFVFEAQIFGED